MKKLALALVCFASLAFFASCIKEGQPTIQVYNQEGYVQDGATVNLDEQVDFGFVVASSAVTNKELVSLVVDIDGDEWANIDLTGHTEYTYKDYVTYGAEKDEIIGTSVITAIVTDAAGQTATATITLTINQPDQDLVSSTFTWTRRGNNLIDNTAESLASYGLTWPGNWKDVMVTLRPVNDDVILYLCNGDDFNNIVTTSDKNAYFTNLAAEGATPISDYRNITTNNSANYNDMLAIVNGEELHLILIKRAEVEYLGSSIGTQIIITGSVK